MEDISEMRREFEAWLNQVGLELTTHQRRLAISAFQAAYTPRPTVEVVARALFAAAHPKENVEEWDITGMRNLAQAAIDTIFNRKG